MFSKKKMMGILMLTALCVLSIYIVFDKNAETLRNGIEISLQEDFKIKESLGQVFFLQKDEDAHTVSSNVAVTSMKIPCEGEISQKELFGEVCIVICCDEFASVCATENGVIESCGDGRITLRHDDGKLSTYFGAVCLLSKGQRVLKGENIGFAQSEITYKLYENCVALNPLDYLA